MSRRDNVTRSQFKALAERVEDLEDVLFLSRAEASSDERKYLPVKMVERMVAGESRIRIWRENRGMTAKMLAEAAGVDPAYLSEIETGKKPGSVKALQSVAKALRVSLDDVVG
ncbi:MAG: XRE family transcriptional regulator [Rhodospirillales bacterium]|nr:XRE family transcriptional regulator [Rhodospirillales bacterium]